MGSFVGEGAFGFLGCFGGGGGMLASVSLTPSFIWESSPNKLVFVGIFLNNIEFVPGSNTISNENDNIWAWHSGLGTGRIGLVAFEDGVEVMNGEFQENKTPTPLLPNEGYVYAIWGWDDSGSLVTHSSPEIFFITGN